MGFETDRGRVPPFYPVHPTHNYTIACIEFETAWARVLVFGIYN
mgnify:CR=1 FL=1